MLAVQSRAQSRAHTAVINTDTASLTKEAHRWLALLRANAVADEDLERLDAVCQELDRRGVPYAGR